MGFLRSVLTGTIGEVLQDAQTGGRPHRGCDMAVLTVLESIRRSRRAKRSYVTGFYDLQAAFYSVFSRLRVEQLVENGLSPV